MLDKDTIYQVRHEANPNDPADRGSLLKEFKTFREARLYAEAEVKRTGDKSIFLSTRQ